MKTNSEFLDYLMEQLNRLGPVRRRAMFGGHGLYLEDVMFALVDDDTLYFKVDDASRLEYEQRGLAPFSYTRKGKTITMSYSEAPAEVLDDEDEMHHWAQKAVAAALKNRR